MKTVEYLVHKIENTIEDSLDILNDYDKDSHGVKTYVDEQGNELSKDRVARKYLEQIMGSIRGLKSTLGDYDRGVLLQSNTMGTQGTDATRPFNI